MEISRQTARRFILGRSGLWPGRRWHGLRGTECAMRSMEHMQLDPLQIMARAQDLMLHSRVIDYDSDDWTKLTYDRRRFFEWGGWLAVRPMDELPHWRVLMRRVRDQPRWQAVAREHGPAIDEMREVLRRRTVANRDFAMHERTRIDSYRGRKDSALALHYLWIIGEAMVSRRERFERVYARTDWVAPRALMGESDDAEADDFLLRKMVASQGLSRFSGVSALLQRPVSAGELATWRANRLADGTLMQVRVEEWPGVRWALATDAKVLAAIDAGRVPAGWRPLESDTMDEAVFLAPLDPVMARARAHSLFDFDYTWEVYVPVAKRRYGYYTLPVLWGDRLVARFDGRLDRPTRTLQILGLWLEDGGLSGSDAFQDAFASGMTRFLGFLDADAIQAAGVTQVAIRRRLAALQPDRPRPPRIETTRID